MDSEKKLHNARVFQAIRNIREAIRLKKIYGLKLSEREKGIVGER